LIVGLGYSGLQVHLPLLDRLRDNDDDQVARLLSPEPPVAYDADPDAADYADEDLEVVESLSRASELLYPGNTVVHVCLPLRHRVTVLPELVERGYRLILLDDPLASDADSLHQLLSLSARYRLRVGVLAPWLSSGITRRLLAAVADGRFGRVRRIVVRQFLPRLNRTFAAAQPGTALDAELPRSVALALALAGNGEVVNASVEPTPVVDGRQVPQMGGASMTIQHSGGVVTEIATDLAAPMWDQRVVVEFENGTVECHYPLGVGDDYAQIFWRPARGNPRREIFVDDSTHQAMLDIYGLFVSESWPEPNLRLHARVVEMLADAKTLCQRAVQGAHQPSPIAETPRPQVIPARPAHRIEPPQLPQPAMPPAVTRPTPMPQQAAAQAQPMRLQSAPLHHVPAQQAQPTQQTPLYQMPAQPVQLQAVPTQQIAPAAPPPSRLGLPPGHPSGPQPSARLAASLAQAVHAFEPDLEPAEPRRYYHRH
jgi:predicted dehydrogenase